MSIRGGLFNHYGGPHKVIFYKKKIGCYSTWSMDYNTRKIIDFGLKKIKMSCKCGKMH